MDGPLSQFLKLGYSTEMLLSVFVGMGFGFALERAGFGRSDNLAAVFYGRDFRVLRVMFSAIVTAMLGLYFLDLFRIMPISSIGLLDTYLWAQLVGGLLLGVGFIVGGWCPGTSIVGAVSGKVDAVLFIGGLVVGSTLFTLGFESFQVLQNAGARGRVLLHDFLGVPSGVAVFGVTLFAVGAFWAVGRIQDAVVRRYGPMPTLAQEGDAARATVSAPAVPAAGEGSLS
jgi:uncharacterized protein